MPSKRIRYDQMGVISLIDEAANAICSWWQHTTGGTSSRPLNRPMTIRSLAIKSFDWEATPAANHRARNEKRLRSETINGESNTRFAHSGLTTLFVSPFWHSVSLPLPRCRRMNGNECATGSTLEARALELNQALWTTIEPRGGWETQTQVLFSAARRDGGSFAGKQISSDSFNSIEHFEHAKARAKVWLRDTRHNNANELWKPKQPHRLRSGVVSVLFRSGGGDATVDEKYMY